MILFCNVSRAYLVYNGSTISFVTVSKVFIIVMIILPKILEHHLSNEDLYDLLVQIQNDGMLSPWASSKVILQCVAK